MAGDKIMENQVVRIAAFDSFFTVPLILVAIVIDLFLLIDGTAILGQSFSTYEPILTTYLAMDSIMLAGTRFIKEINITFMGAMLFFVPAFVMTALLVGSISSSFAAVETKTLGFSYYITEILLQIFVVTLSEELMFRGILEKYFGWFPQGIMFGLFHITAYNLEGFSWEGVFIAMIFGLFLGYIVKIFSVRGKTSDGIALTWGIHAGWNVAVILGIFGLGALF